MWQTHLAASYCGAIMTPGSRKKKTTFEQKHFFKLWLACTDAEITLPAVYGMRGRLLLRKFFRELHKIFHFLKEALLLLTERQDEAFNSGKTGRKQQ